jgi:hypothetical protein
MRQALGRAARYYARRIAVMVYIGGFGVLLLAAFGLYGAPMHEVLYGRWVVVGVLASISMAASGLAVLFAARWSATLRLPRPLRWVPVASVLGMLLATVGVAIMLVSPSSQSSNEVSLVDTPAELQSSLNLVSGAYTRTMSAGESQAWLDQHLPRNIGRAWYVTPAGVIALSSITTVNEINRNVMDFIAITQTTSTPLANLTERDQSLIAALRSPATLTRAIGYSNTPVLLLIMVKQALLNLAPSPYDTQVAARVMQHDDGSFAGVAAVTRLTPSPTLFTPIVFAVLAGWLILCASWAIWVYLTEWTYTTARRTRNAQPMRWAMFTALVLPVGLLAYLYKRSGDGNE